MSLILVYHDTAVPALYGAAAAAVAAARGSGFMHVSARFDTTRHADAVQHVVASGGLAASGLCWFERLSGKPVSPEATSHAILDVARSADIVVPIHPVFLVEQNIVAALSSGAKARGINVETITVVDDGDTFRDVSKQSVLAWRDRFGRVTLTKPSGKPSTDLTIGIVGAETDHRDAYPATLACLADAADTLSLAINIRFIDPVKFDRSDDPETLRDLSGVLLPGGANMKNVPGQTAVAAFALENALPTVGLCLGMQTMATAVAWKTFGRRNANLAEANPDAAIKTFVAMAGETDASGKSLPSHRTGDQTMKTMANTYLSKVISSVASVRCNHRFRLNPAIVPDLETNGLRVSARGLFGAVVDAIEVPGHVFFMGMQGHPELSSRSGAPHPLIIAFLQAATRNYQSTAL